MSTQYATIKCYIQWAKVYEPDVAFGAENWKGNFYPVNEAEWEKYSKTGLQLTKKKNDSADPLLGGSEFITLRRPTKKVIKDDLVVFSPPEISGLINVKYINEEGDKVRQYNKGDKIKVTRVDGEDKEIVGKIDWTEKTNTEYLIPNGSTVLVNFSYYDTVKGKGHRLESIRVLELAEYAPPTEDKAEIKEETKVEKAKTEKKTISEDLNDDLDSIPW